MSKLEFPKWTYSRWLEEVAFLACNLAAFSSLWALHLRIRLWLSGYVLQHWPSKSSTKTSSSDSLAKLTVWGIGGLAGLFWGKRGLNAEFGGIWDLGGACGWGIIGGLTRGDGCVGWGWWGDSGGFFVKGENGDDEAWFSGSRIPPWDGKRPWRSNGGSPVLNIWPEMRK